MRGCVTATATATAGGLVGCPVARKERFGWRSLNTLLGDQRVHQNISWKHGKAETETRATRMWNRWGPGGEKRNAIMRPCQKLFGVNVSSGGGNQETPCDEIQPEDKAG